MVARARLRFVVLVCLRVLHLLSLVICLYAAACIRFASLVPV